MVKNENLCNICQTFICIYFFLFLGSNLVVFFFLATFFSLILCEKISKVTIKKQATPARVFFKIQYYYNEVKRQKYWSAFAMTRQHARSKKGRIDVFFVAFPMAFYQ